MAVGTGGGGGQGGIAPPPPPNFCQPKQFKTTRSLYKQLHINPCIAIWLKYDHGSVDIGNHRYTNVQNCILLKYVGLKNNFDRLRRENIFAPHPLSQKRSSGYVNISMIYGKDPNFKEHARTHNKCV